MAFGECPVCGEKYHLRITDPNWHKERGLEIGDVLKEKCFCCWKELKEYDVVEVISVPDGNDEIEVGDIGAVLLVHEQKGKESVYEVECVRSDGTNKWLQTMKRNNLKYVFEKNEK